MVIHPALFEPAAEGGYLVTFPNFGWGGTQGETEAEAHEMAQDLLVLLVSHSLRNRETIPKPGKMRGKNVRAVALPALATAKVALYHQMQANGIKKAELARRMKQPKQQVERLMDLSHASRLDQLEAAFAAIGKQLVVVIQDAA